MKRKNYDVEMFYNELKEEITSEHSRIFYHGEMDEAAPWKFKAVLRRHHIDVVIDLGDIVGCYRDPRIDKEPDNMYYENCKMFALRYRGTEDKYLILSNTFDFADEGGLWIHSFQSAHADKYSMDYFNKNLRIPSVTVDYISEFLELILEERDICAAMDEHNDDNGPFVIAIVNDTPEPLD